MNTKTLCLRLLAAESEAEVQQIIDETPELADQGNWRPLDGRETNFNITSNQASDGGKALTELMTNMVDAVLMKHAHLKGIDPKGPNAPQTMYEAVDTLIKQLHGGKLSNLDARDPWLRDFAQKNLVIGITGAKTKRSGLPCYTFVDNGEGQNPQDFPRTFLSLSEGNKKSIPFVQGKYNMGSSGVLGYCGMRWFKLILSRRYDGQGPWGWTLMRRRPTGGMPIADYFVLPDGSIPSFSAEALYPFHRQDGKRYDGMHLSSGSVIKLYDYQVGSKFSGWKSREALNENLVETILPFRMLDFRHIPKTAAAREAAAKRGGERAEGIDPRPFYGMEFLLLRSHKEDGHAEDEEDAVGTDRISVGQVIDPALGEIDVSAIPLKRKLPGWLEGTNNRVFHTVNGQVQFKQTRGYVSQTCGLPALKDRMVLIVDASNLSFGAHNDIWKGDREHIRNTIVGERYRDAVTTAIRESAALKALQERFAREELDQAAKSERNELFQKLVDSDRNLAALLTSRDPIIRLPASGGTSGGESGSGAFEGKFSPTFLRFEEKTRLNGLAIPFNKARPVAARTDVENGYLRRADNTGRLLIDEALRERFGIRTQLHDGRLTIYFEPQPDKVAIGDSIECRIGLQDDSMPTPVEDVLTIRIVDEESEGKPQQKKTESERRAGDGQNQEGKGENAPTHGLPRYMLLTKQGRHLGSHETQPWPEGFNEQDGGLVEDLGDGEVIYKINYDNTYHLNYRLQQRGDVARDAVTEKYVLGMRILMLGYEHAFRLTKKSARDDGDSTMMEFIDDFRRMAARGAASTVLALAENLPKIVDSTALTKDVE